LNKEISSPQTCGVFMQWYYRKTLERRCGNRIWCGYAWRRIFSLHAVGHGYFVGKEAVARNGTVTRGELRGGGKSSPDYKSNTPKALYLICPILSTLNCSFRPPSSHFCLNIDIADVVKLQAVANTGLETTPGRQQKDF
jgi:hypothetical protein